MLVSCSLTGKKEEPGLTLCTFRPPFSPEIISGKEAILYGKSGMSLPLPPVLAPMAESEWAAHNIRRKCPDVHKVAHALRASDGGERVQVAALLSGPVSEHFNGTLPARH